MKMVYPPTEPTRLKAMAISKYKEDGLRYKDIKKYYNHSKVYLIYLKQLGDQLREEKHEE